MDSPRKHQPNRLRNYLSIHRTILDTFIASGIVSENLLTFEAGYEGEYRFGGELDLCDGHIRLQVTKVLKTIPGGDADDPDVQTDSYSYNVSLRGVGTVFRYDSPHLDSLHIPHHNHHHRHQYDPFSDKETNDPVISPDGDWPVLSEVINEANDWYCDNLDRIEAVRGTKRS